MRKLWKFLSSMGFAVTLLVLLAAACALSSLVEQGLTKEAYTARYGEGTASLIMALQVNDAYHSVWFIALSGFLCLNLILCNIIRFPSFLQRYRLEKDPGKAVNTAGELGETGTAEPEAVFDSMGLKTRIRCRDAEGQEVLFAHRGAFGIWGPWVCHLGVLLLIAGFALGQMTMEEATVWGIPGDRVSLAGTGLTVTIDDFRTETREDGSVAQYITEMTVTDNDGKAEKVIASVNHPGFRRRVFAVSEQYGVGSQRNGCTGRAGCPAENAPAPPAAWRKASWGCRIIRNTPSILPAFARCGKRDRRNGTYFSMTCT